MCLVLYSMDKQINSYSIFSCSLSLFRWGGEEVRTDNKSLQVLLDALYLLIYPMCIPSTRNVNNEHRLNYSNPHPGIRR